MATVFLIPSLLHEEGIASIPDEILDTIKKCRVFFVENERTTRRYFKKLWKEMVIDDYEWFTIEMEENKNTTTAFFKKKLEEGKDIGIVSEAGCPGIADPGQVLVRIAQEMNARVQPLTGPNSMTLALMASGMNGQVFQFNGYLPIPQKEREKMIRQLESLSKVHGSTQIFIETPYRNNQLVEALLATCNGETRLCIAVDLTSSSASVKTKTIREWKTGKPDLHKRPTVFLIQAG